MDDFKNTLPVVEIGDWVNLLIHLIFALVYILLVYKSIKDDPYQSEDLHFRMYPTFHPAAWWCGVVSLLVGVAFLLLASTSLSSDIFIQVRPDLFRYQSIYLYVLFASSLMLIGSAIALWREWNHGVGLFLIATVSAISYSFFTVIAFRNIDDYFWYQAVSIIGSSAMLLSSGFLYTAQYFYKEKLTS